MLSPILDESLKTPIYIQLYNYIKKEIVSNNLKKDERLPSKRVMATHLGISVNTVSNAYGALSDEGYIYSKERSGYFVSDIDNLLKIHNDPDEEVKKKEIEKYRYDFKINNIDNVEFPVYTFRRIISETMNYDRRWLENRDFQGMFELRSAIKRYIYNARGVKTEEKNIVISSGLEYLLQILFYILPMNSIFGLENPGYRAIRDLFFRNNITCNYIDIKSFGIDFKDIKNSNIVMLTPSHQFPTGFVMPVNSRVNILNWANEDEKRYIIEDDYDSEFKYYGKPIPALKSLDTADNVIYIGNFSKSISPMLRVSYMVLPDKLLNKYFEIMPFINCPVSGIIQLSVAKFINDGYFERHLNRMRNIYREKRDIAVSVFEDNDKFRIYDRKAGLHFIVEVNNGMTEDEIVDLLRKNDIYVEGLGSYYIDGNGSYENPEIIIGFGKLSMDELEEGVKKIVELL